jgi:branched-chain amino acid transport system substrate-binding protein
MRQFRTVAAALTFGAGLLLGTFNGALADTFKLGVIAPLTGGGAPWGLAGKLAYEILAAEVNAKGGLKIGSKTYQLEIISYDDQYRSADSVAAYNRLLNQDGVKYMLIETSAAAVALKRNVEEDKVIATTTAYTSSAIDADAKYFFRVYSSPDDYLPGLVKWIRDNTPEKRVVIINPNDETGWSQAKLSESEFLKQGFELLKNEVYERTLKDFQPFFTRIIAMKPELIDLGTTAPATAGLMIRQARELGYTGKFVKSGGPGWSEIVAAAGAKDTEGLIGILYADPENKAYQRLAAEYKKRMGHDPNEILLPIYDGANVMLRAIQEAGGIDDTSKVAAAFAKVLPIESVQGDKLALGRQQFTTTNYVSVIKNGKPVVLGKIR